MENHLVGDTNCNIVNLECPKTFLQGMTNNVRFSVSVSDTTHAIYK